MTHSQKELKEAFENSLKSLADVALEHYSESKPNLSDEALLNGILIFQTCLYDKLWDRCNELELCQDQRNDIGTELGNDIRNIVKKYTDIDTHELVKKLYPEK